MGKHTPGVDVRAAIREGRNATAGWPGSAMAAVSDRLSDAETALIDLLATASAMSRVHIAKGNDLGRAKQRALREAIRKATGESHG